MRNIYVLNASAGSYVVTGQTANLIKTRLLFPQNGVYTIAGQAVNIVYNPTPPAPSTLMEYFVEIRSFTERKRIS